MLNSNDVERVIGSPLYNSKHIPFCITSSALKFAYVSEPFCKISGYKAEELIGKSVAIVLTPRNLIDAFNEYFYYRRNQKNKKFLWRVRGKHGQVIETKIETSIIKINGKNYSLTLALDYSDLGNAAFAVQATEEKYRLLTETMPHIVWTNDISGKPIYMNNVAKIYFGKKEEDFATWDWLEYFEIEEARALEKEWDMASQMKNPVQKIARIRRHDNELKWFQIILYPQFNEVDDTISWTAIATDIDDRIKAEQKLSKANTRLRSLIDSAPIPIYTLDEHGKVNDIWNRAAERILGWEKQEVLGKTTPLATKEHFEDYKNNLEKIKKNGSLKKIVKRKIKSGDEITVEINSGSIYDDAGNVDEILITLLDITEIENQKLQLEESLEEKKTLLQEIHHRVKNNLAIVVSLLQLQVYQSSSKKEKNKLLDAQNRVMSIAMVHELLYSTDEFNKVNLATYYEQLIRTIKSNMITGTKGVDHIVNIGDVSLNITQAIPLGLLINELATNSLKYAFPEESSDNIIELSIHALDDKIKVTYCDNGVGFDMSDVKFKTGLGFKIMDSLLNQLEADYEMKTENGFDLTFTFTSLLQNENIVSEMA